MNNEEAVVRNIVDDGKPENHQLADPIKKQV